MYDDDRSAKVRKVQQGQSASSSSYTPPPQGKTRRAARACEQCRTSKLRCLAAEPQSNDTRCGHCAKMDLVCEYTGPPPPPIKPASMSLGEEGPARLSQLEDKVSKLLDLLQGKAQTSPQSMQQPQAEYRPPQPPDPTVDPRLKPHMPTSSLIALADFAVSGVPSPAGNSDLETRWLTDAMPAGGGMLPQQGQPSYTPRDRIEPPQLVLTESPNAPSDTALSQHSARSLLDPHVQPFSREERYSQSQARPIPRAAAASRMAAFTEPSSHEAPFRSLTYNPDTFRNSEISREGSVEEQEPSMGPDTIRNSHDGRKTPKKGGGDPIEKGIFTEESALALFNFFHREIHFFLPILQEPISFDFIRHKSSFLLSTILAIAAKYCGAASVRSGANSPPQDVRHGVQIVDEESWIQIRSLVLSSYFQAMISKVHCLEDVQATLLLGAWGLHDRGASPDPWLLTGAGYRLARRLGIHLASASLISGVRQPSARTVAGYKTYLALYAFDRLLTVGFGRPETEGFDPSTIDTSILLRSIESDNLGHLVSQESAACIAAYVELANVARDYSQLVNVTLKASPSMCLSEMEKISSRLDVFSSRWLRARSPLGLKLGLSSRPVKMLYNHIRLCLHSVPLKPASHPGSQVFLQDTRLDGPEGRTFLLRCLKMTEDFAAGVIQAFADDVRDDEDSVMCYAYDYASMVLSHSAALLIRLATTRVCGVGDPVTSPRNRRDAGMDDLTAMRYCAMAITALVESNRSANQFSCDMAGNLCLIAKEMGMTVSDWTSETVVKTIEQRAAPTDPEHFSFPPSFETSVLPTAFDFSLFSDFDMSLQSGFFEDANFFSNSI